MRKTYCAYLPHEIVPDGMRIDVGTTEEVLGGLGFCLPEPAVAECKEIYEAGEMLTIEALGDEIARSWMAWMQGNAERGPATRHNPETGHRVALGSSQP